MAKLRDIARKAKDDKDEKLRDIAGSRQSGTVHMGGTPLFDEARGRYLTPAEIILRKRLKQDK